MAGRAGPTLWVSPGSGPGDGPTVVADPGNNTPAPEGTAAMTMDKSLRVRKGSSSARGVLSRAERIVKLKEQERWGEGRSPLGLPKVRVYKMAMKKKKKAKEEGADAAAGKGAAAKAPAGGAKKK